MSATSSSTDPVQTVIDLLSGTSSGDYPNGTKPDPIEAHWVTDFRTKSNRGGVAVYVRSPELGTQGQLSTAGDTKTQTETVSAEVWAVAESDATDVAGDVRSILEDYWNDRETNTEWHRIRPQDVDDRRQEHLARRTDHYVQEVIIELQTEDSIGT